MANVRVKMNSKGARAVLRSEEVRADLARRAGRIAAAAGVGFAADSSVGANRARAAAYTASARAARAEAKDKRLTRALDAGRGA